MFFGKIFRGSSVGRSWKISKQQGRLRASWRCGGMRVGSKESGEDERGSKGMCGCCRGVGTI